MKTTALRKVPYVAIAAQHASIKSEILEAVEKVLTRGQFILGDEVAEFEKRFAELCGVRFALALNSGTDALVLALRALGIGSGDQVITAPNSFVSSTSCIRLVGARPIFVDSGEDYNLDPSKLGKAITSKTKAILSIHLTGRPAQMDKILEIAAKHNLHVIEDAAQAVLAEYQGKRVGSFGTFGCFSLHPLKTLNACGDGGVLTMNDEKLYKKIKILRNLGLKTRDECVEWSAHSRLDTLQAAILLVKLKYVEAWTEKRRANAAFYQTELDQVPEIKVPKEQPFEKSVYHTFVIQADRRDELKDFLMSRGVGTNIHYPLPIHLQPVAQELGYARGDFPVAERHAQRILSLPVHQDLKEDDLAYVADTIKEFYGVNGQ